MPGQSEFAGEPTTEPLDRSRKDYTLFQFTTKQLRDFIDHNHLAREGN